MNKQQEENLLALARFAATFWAHATMVTVALESLKDSVQAHTKDIEIIGGTAAAIYTAQQAQDKAAEMREAVAYLVSRLSPANETELHHKVREINLWVKQEVRTNTEKGLNKLLAEVAGKIDKELGL